MKDNSVSDNDEDDQPLMIDNCNEFDPKDLVTGISIPTFNNKETLLIRRNYINMIV